LLTVNREIDEHSLNQQLGFQQHERSALFERKFTKRNFGVDYKKIEAGLPKLVICLLA